MAASKAIFSPEVFKFFADLKRHNKKEWMDKHRERYQEAVQKPFKRLLEELAPAVLELDHNIEAMGRRGKNFSRINRDIRFSKDKTLYHLHMYLKFPAAPPGGMEGGELYCGISAEAVTAGFRIYGGPKRKESALALVAEPKLAANGKLLAQMKARLGKKYESYWYESLKGKWTQKKGWPTAEEWPRLQGWIVRKKLSKSAATRANFPAELSKIFREVYPVLKFTSL